MVWVVIFGIWGLVVLSTDMGGDNADKAATPMLATLVGAVIAVVWPNAAAQKPTAG